MRSLVVPMIVNKVTATQKETERKNMAHKFALMNRNCSKLIDSLRLWVARKSSVT